MNVYGTNLQYKGAKPYYMASSGGFVTVKIKEIMKEYFESKCNKLVINGGEPLLQADPIDRFIRKINREKKGTAVIYTNGTRWPLPIKTQVYYVVVPIFSGNKNTHHRRLKTDILIAFRNRNTEFNFEEGIINQAGEREYKKFLAWWNKR